MLRFGARPAGGFISSTGTPASCLEIVGEGRLVPPSMETLAEFLDGFLPAWAGRHARGRLTVSNNHGIIRSSRWSLHTY